jgi:hypothetical protein
LARRRRLEASAGVTSALPPDLAAGPCLERWAADVQDPVKAWYTARRNWHDAGRAWAISVAGVDNLVVNWLLRTPLMRELAGDQPPPSTEPVTETFDVRGFEIPSGNIMI